MMIKGLYIHIPFCDQICLYCDFCKLVAKKALKEKYLNSVLKELKFFKQKFLEIETIYLGGGTPSSLDFESLDILLANVKELINQNNIVEYTVEVNPNDLDINLLKLFQKHQVSRISIGVQTISNQLLSFLKRGHTAEDVLTALLAVSNSGFMNFNLDFIYGIPGQTLEDLQKDLDFIKQKRPPHISYYALIVEPKTELSYLIETGKIKPLDDDIVADYAEYVHNTLIELGYTRYEFSNYALNNYDSKHNLLYWNLEEYIGIGMGAASQYDGSRFINPSRISDYIRKIESGDMTKSEEEFLPEMEYILLGLRKIAGISLQEYERRFGICVFAKYPGLLKHLENGLLIQNGDILRFSKKGIELSNQVYLEII